MSAIEKICEFSGDYPAHEMYGYKRDHIQICPEYRKKFKGASATLTIIAAEVRPKIKYGKFVSYRYPCVWTIREDFNCNARLYLEDLAYYDDAKLSIEYEYTLTVTDPELQGQVEGRYLNFSRNLSAVKRRLRRMVGPNLIIKNNIGSRKEIIKKFIQELEYSAREGEAH